MNHPLFSLFLTILAFQKYIPLGGFGGPEKDQVLFCGTAISMSILHESSLQAGCPSVVL